MIRFGILLTLLCAWVPLSTDFALGQPGPVQSSAAQSTVARSPQEIAQIIDRLIEQSAVGPLATVSSDADFLRRVTLDLTGVIPDADTTRAFLADTAGDKRQREIERLLASAEFNRFMTLQFSVSLLERRTEKNVPHRNWERFLYASMESDKPLDELMSELVYAEPISRQHPANKFLLSREGEPNAVTRDVGRLAFGMDLQCAQCHNHPLIENYLQEDYYGLYAFLHRTTLFTQPSTKQIKLVEKPEGEASFRSVFTGNARDHTTPRLPKEQSLLEEPVLLGEAMYKEKPSKESGGVPAYSRRQALAKMMQGSRQFQRNLANRLWAHMFSRGLVHPLDFHHRDNAPSHPQLLDALSEALVANGFKIRPMLAGIALSRCYQRSCEPPNADAINFADVAARCELLTSKLSVLQESTERWKSAATGVETAYNLLLARHDAHAVDLAKAVKDASEATDKFEKAREAFQKVDAPYRKSLAQSIALGSANETLTAALALMSDDKQLVDISTKLSARVKKLEEGLPALEKAAKEKQTILQTAQVELDKKQLQLANVQAARVPTSELQTFEKRQIDSSRALADHLFAVDQLSKQVELCKLLTDYQAQRQADPSKAAAVWQSILDRWTVQGQVAPLKALTPEQLTLSALRGTGALNRHMTEAQATARAIRAKAEAKSKAADKKAEADAKAAPPSTNEKDSEQPADAAGSIAALEQQSLIDSVRSRLDQFAALYGGLPGEDFQATVNQALFFGNGNMVDEWLKPAQNNLTDKLVQLSDQEVPERMFLSILSRPPSESEKQDVVQSLTVEGADRSQVVRRWLWALLSSSEFRFNH